MHNRRARWLVPFLTASLLFSASAASTAFAKNGKGGGKKARGEVTSFDSTSMALVVAMKNGDTFEGTVSPDVQVKVEHRGDHTHGHGHGNPSHGTLEDIVAGAQVLRMKVGDEGVVEKLRLRKKVDEAAGEEVPGEDVGEEPGDDSGDDEVEEEPGDDVGDDEGDDVGDDEGGDVGEDEGDDVGDDEGDDGVEDEPADDAGDEPGSEGGV